ncbi:MAG: hypothetical protein J0M17_15190 [Planctomycetes bacterium]|nr:hypothetical protein [Planctomycetota bacterium]
MLRINRSAGLPHVALVIVAAMSQFALAAPPTGERVFYTGHSFHMFVPPLVDQLAKSAGITDHRTAGRQGIGGSKVIQHWDKADAENTAKQALRSGEVDVFTMAPHLMVPDPGITNFVELGLKHNAGVKFYLQASWYPFDVADPEKRIRDNAARDAMKIEDLQAAVDEWRTRLEAQADDLNKQHGKKCVYITPVGDAVVKLRAMIVAGKFPGITKQSELFRDPIGHGLGPIMALAAYCNYAAIYKASPEGLTMTIPDVTPEQHKILQQIAWETVSGYAYSGVKTGAR